MDDIITKGECMPWLGQQALARQPTVAKLAAQAVARYSADQVALISADHYRIGARELLKIYGKVIGVPVFPIGCADELRSTLLVLSPKHFVLIDAEGMGQRDDRRMDAQKEMFKAAGVRC